MSAFSPSKNHFLTFCENALLPGYEESVLLISALYTKHRIMVGRMSRNAGYWPFVYVKQCNGKLIMTSDLQNILTFCLYGKKWKPC